MINAEKIAEMRDNVIVLNCARGEFVNTQDMANALKYGKVDRYGADVLDAEPPAPDHILIGAPNCIITSHIGSRTHESVQLSSVCIRSLVFTPLALRKKVTNSLESFD